MSHEHTPHEDIQEVKVATMRYVFYGLQVAGLLGAFLMLLTAGIWRKAARRHASWFNFMITWIISCSSYIFLIGKPMGHEPSHGLCLFQEALIYSVPTLTTGATIALVIHVYITLHCMLTAINHRASWTVALVVGPYVPAWAMFVYTLRTGLNDPSLVQRLGDGMYCSLRTTMPGRVSGIVVATISLACLAVEAIIFRNLRRAWTTLKRERRSSVSMIIRVLAFTMIGMLSIILSLILLALPDDHGAAFDIVISIIPVSSVLIFGTQKDILTAWCSLCRRKPHDADTWETFTPNGTMNAQPLDG
ncbi:hypothetical protein DFH09DRAFT_1140111 [Mycena vulgaris]|nr:hypothetical protein DFH09DRAFT_1140111 [Mycena vulgaris]